MLKRTDFVHCLQAAFEFVAYWAYKEGKIF